MPTISKLAGGPAKSMMSATQYLSGFAPWSQRIDKGVLNLFHRPNAVKDLEAGFLRISASSRVVHRMGILLARIRAHRIPRAGSGRAGRSSAHGPLFARISTLIRAAASSVRNHSCQTARLAG